jgi:hypothetical protein
MFGLSLAQWLVIVESAPQIIALVEKIGPVLVTLFKAIEGLTTQISPQGGTSSDVANFLASKTTPVEWNNWARQMRPDLVVPTQ